MSEVGKRIIAGLNDALAWVNGDESRARVITVRHLNRPEQAAMHRALRKSSQLIAKGRRQKEKRDAE